MQLAEGTSRSDMEAEAARICRAERRGLPGSAGEAPQICEYFLLGGGVKTHEGGERTTERPNNSQNSQKELGEFTVPKEGLKSMT